MITGTNDGRGAAASFESAFAALPGMFLLLTPQLTIVGASDEYLAATMTVRERIVGRRIWEVFPDKPDDPDAEGERDLGASFARVLRDGVPDTVVAGKFDIERPASTGGGFEERWWQAHNRPVFDRDGNVCLILNCVLDVTEQLQHTRASDQLERELENNVDLTRLIIDRAHSGFVSMDAAGRITEWNPSAELIFGWKKTEVVGRLVADVVMPPRYRQAHQQGLERFLQTGEGPVLGKQLELEGLRRDGSEFPIAITISAIELAGEHSFHAFIQDVSERKRAESERERHAAELAAANAKLAAADRLKDQFLAMASHELRTPLTAIAGFTSTLLNLGDSLSDQQKREFLGIIDRQTSRLQRLVDDLLTLSRIESGAVEPRAELIDVSIAIKQTIRELGQERISVTCEPPQLGALADADHLQQILTNYLSNALKYGSQPIQVDARFTDLGVEIRVRDSGPGVPPDFVPRLFDRFSQARQGVSVIEGTGLGLSIVRGLARMQGGEAWYEPNEPHGSCFALRLPAAASAAGPNDAGHV